MASHNGLNAPYTNNAIYITMSVYVNNKFSMSYIRLKQQNAT